MKWVPISDKLPENVGEEVLVVGGSGLGPEPYITTVTYLGGHSFGHKRDDELNGFSVSSITHWMSLPEPPSEAYAPALRRWEEGQAIIREAELRGKAN